MYTSAAVAPSQGSVLRPIVLCSPVKQADSLMANQCERSAHLEERLVLGAVERLHDRMQRRLRVGVRRQRRRPHLASKMRCETQGIRHHTIPTSHIHTSSPVQALPPSCACLPQHCCSKTETPHHSRMLCKCRSGLGYCISQFPCRNLEHGMEERGRRADLRHELASGGDAL